MKNLILVDFDGTLTERDTTRYLIFQLLAVRPWLVGAVLRPFLSMALARNQNDFQNGKYRLIGRLLRGLAPAELDSALMGFSKVVRRLRRARVINALEERRKNGRTILVVTASPEFAVSAALADLRVDVVGTRFAIENNKFTGEICGSGCYGVEKRVCVAKWTHNSGEEILYEEAWSDATSDLPMMRLALSRYWVCAPEDEYKIRSVDPGGCIFSVGPS